MEFPIGRNGEILWIPTPVTNDREVQDLIMDDNFVIQVKADGIHKLALRRDDDADPVRGFTRKGLKNPIHPTLIKAMQALGPQTLLDGEELHFGAGFEIFDVCAIDGEDLRDAPYADRYRLCQERVIPLVKAPVRLVQSISGAIAKIDFLNDMRLAGEEGVVFKDLRAPYRPGRPTEGGPMRKRKFIERATVILKRRTPEESKALGMLDTTRSFQMYACDGPQTLDGLGSVSARHFFDRIPVGEAVIADVDYLYASPDFKLIQPVLWGFREDKTMEECTVGQLKIGGRFRENGGK